MGVHMEYKTCPQCGEIYPLTSEFFYANKHKSNGFCCYCKKCTYKRKEDYRKRNPEKIKAYLEKTVERRREVARKSKHKPENIRKQKEYIMAHREQILKRCAKYRDSKREELRKKANEYYYKNYDACRKRTSDYRKRTQHIKNIQTQQYRARKKSLECSLTNEQWESIKLLFNNCCAYCGKESSLSQDHFIPITSNGEYTINNIVPACKSCNSSKSNKNFFEWYPKFRHYSKKREKKILDFLGYDANGQQQLKLNI